MNTVSARFPCGDITLEGEWLFPGGRGPFPAVVVCHPYPPRGGDMFNSVVAAICAALAGHSLSAFRFNFRGVGQSEGSFGEGISERDDVKAALDFVLSSPEIDSRRVGLAGYSFGGMVALPVAAGDGRISRLAVVSSPFSDSDWQQFREYANDKLYVMGDADQMVSREMYQRQTGGIPRPEQYQMIPGADHFMGGYEDEVGRIVAGFFAGGFNNG